MEIIQKYFFNKIFLLVLILIGFSLTIRLFLYPYDIPLSLDALNAYFLYANDTRILGHFPIGLANNGWPGFLSIFFSIFHFETSVGYMNLQRIISISFSVLTIIPIYYLGKKFFDKHYAILGAVIFAFEPRIIQNSLLGGTEAMYLFLIAVSLSLFFMGNKKTYISFIVVGLASIVRAEGLFLFFGMTTVLIIQNRIQIKKMFLKLFISIGLFIGSILPMSIERFMRNGSDSLISRAVAEGGNMAIRANQEGAGTNLMFYFIEGLKTPMMLLGWSSIPLFIFFVPASIISIIKDRSKDHFLLITIASFMMIPTLYGLSVGPDTRYVFPLYPLFSVISIYIIKKIFDKKVSKKILITMVFVGIILSSSIFLYFKHTDLDHEREAFEISKQVIQANAINDYGKKDESKYVRVAGFIDIHPELSDKLWRGPITFETEDFSSIQSFIDRYRYENLDYIVVASSNKSIFLDDIFNNEEKYEYLEKIYDSNAIGYDFQVKILKINYLKYDQLN